MTSAASLVSPDAPPASRWFIVATNSKQEKTAAFHLKALVDEIYLPLRASKPAAVPKRHVGAIPLFPRYLFIRVDPRQATWWAIRSAIGVKALVCTGERPAPLPIGFIDAIRTHETDGLVSLRQLESKGGPIVSAGDAVKVEVAGSIFDAVVEEQIDSNRVRLLLSIAGGQKPMRVIARRAQLQSVDLGVKADPIKGS